MSEVNESVGAEKQADKHNTAESRPPSVSSGGPDSSASSLPPPVRPLNRADSRSALSPQSLRPAGLTQPQPRPQFQPGGPVTGPQAFPSRPTIPTPRGSILTGPPQPRQAPQQSRPIGPQSIAPQQGPRPQSPIVRTPPPNSLQFGPRQPLVSGTSTPDGIRSQPLQQPNEIYKNGVQPASRPLPRQPSQGSLKSLDITNTNQSKPVNLDNQSEVKHDIQNDIKAENVVDVPGVAKGRSYSIAAAPGAPNPFKMEDDRRKSVSAIGGKIDEFISRSPGLELIQEVRADSKVDVKSSKENIKSESLHEGNKDASERPESRLSKMTESFMGSLPIPTPKKKADDDSDVIIQNNGEGAKNTNNISKNHNKDDFSDRSPSLTRSDDSPEPKSNVVVNSNVTNKPQIITQELQHPKTPKIEIKHDSNNGINPPPISNKIVPKTPEPDTKSPIQTKPPPQITSPIQAKSPTQITSPLQAKSPMQTGLKKPNELNTSMESKKSTPRKTASAPKSRPKDGDNDSGVDESTQGHDMNGSPGSPNKKIPSKLPTKEKSSNSLKANLSRSSSKSATAKTPENPPSVEKKKVPMNKVQVGNAPSPNIKAVKSKIGSLDNAAYKPGGGKIRIENRKLEFGNVTPKIAAKNDTYSPSGGSKKIVTTKLEWNVKSKVGSLQNASYKPGGGDKKIETVKLDFTDKAKPKVGSTANITHKPGGGGVKIENQKLEFKSQSKVGSMDNVKHKPGGGDIKIFEDKEYIKQMSGQSPLPGSRSHSRQESPMLTATQPPTSDENLNQQQCDNTP